MQKGSENMFGYRIEIQGDASGEIWYNVTFQSGERNKEIKKFNSADTAYIYSTIEQLAEALKAISYPNP